MSKFTERKKMSLLSVVISIIFVSMIALSCGGGGGGGGGGNQVPATQATFDDFIGKWAGPVEVHTDSPEKINVTLTLTVNENGTGTFILDDGNLVETHVIPSFMVVNQFLDFPILNNDPTNPDCKNWDFSLTLSLDGTLQGDGTVCGLFVTISGTLTHTPYYSVRGFVSLPEGAGLKLKDLTLSSPDSDDIAIDSATGKFQLNGFGDLVDILFVTDDNDNLILIGINDSTNVVKSKNRMVSEGTDISVDAMTTAIALVCMDPMLALNNDKEFIAELRDEITGLSEIKVLEEYIKSKIISDPTAVIVENDPVLKDLILKARSASINKLISNYVLTATSSYSNRMLGGGPAINATTDGAYNSGINISVNDFSDKSATFEIKNYYLRYLALYKKKNSLLENNDVGDFVKLIKPCPSIKNLKTWVQWLTGNYAHSSTNITLDFSDTTTYGLTFVGPGGKNKILTTADWDIYKPAYWRSATYLLIAPTINISLKGKADSFFGVLEGFEELLEAIEKILSTIEFVDEWILLYDESPLVKMEFIAKNIWKVLTKNDCEYLLRIERKLRGKSFSGARSDWEKGFVKLTKVISLIDSGWKLAGSTMSMVKASQVGLWAATFVGPDDPADKINSISVTSPTAGTQWQRGTTQTIRWTSSGSVGNVQLQLRNNSGYYSVIANSVANTGSYNWAIPASIAIGSGYQIRVSDVNQRSTIYDHSDSFSLTSAPVDPVVMINVTAPVAGTQWQRGTTQTIRWTSSGSVGNVQLQLRDSSGSYSVIANSVANSGSYNWAIPANGVIGSGFQIRVSDFNKWGTIYDHSDSFSLTSGLPDTTPQPIIVLSNISPQDDNTYLGCPYVDDNIRTVQVTVTVKYNIPEDAPLEKYFLLIRNTFVGSSHFFVQPKDYTPIEVSPGDSGETTITFTVRYYDVYSDCYYYGRNGKFLIYIYFSDRKGPFTIYDSGLEHNAFSEHGVIEYKSRGY